MKHGVQRIRSKDAHQLHTFIVYACESKHPHELNNYLSKIEKFIDYNPSKILTELSFNKYSHLDDALHLPFEINNDKNFSGIISEALFLLLSRKMKERLQKYGDDFSRLILSNKTREGFMLLLTALKSGLPENVMCVIRLLKEPGHEAALMANLLNVTSDDYMILHAALKSGQFEKVAAVIELLKEAGNEAALLANLQHQTKDGFMILHRAFASKNKMIVEAIISLLKERANKEALKANLLHRTKEGFMILQVALVARQPENINAIMTLLTEKGNEEALRENLANVTNDEFMILQHAFASGRLTNVAAVSSLLKKKGNEAVLKANLLNTNRFGYNCLHEAANSGNYELVQALNHLIEYAFADDSHAIKQKLASDKSKFKKSAWNNARIENYLNNISLSGTKRHSQGYYPSGWSQNCSRIDMKTQMSPHNKYYKFNGYSRLRNV